MAQIYLFCFLLRFYSQRSMAYSKEGAWLKPQDFLLLLPLLCFCSLFFCLVILSSGVFLDW